MVGARCVVYRHDESGWVFREVGDLTLLKNGRITAWPNEDATDFDVRFLLAAADHCFQYGRGKGWKVRKTTKTTYRRTTIARHVHKEDDPESLAMAAALPWPMRLLNSDARRDRQSEDAR